MNIEKVVTDGKLVIKESNKITARGQVSKNEPNPGDVKEPRYTRVPPLIPFTYESSEEAIAYLNKNLKIIEEIPLPANYDKKLGEEFKDSGVRKLVRAMMHDEGQRSIALAWAKIPAETPATGCGSYRAKLIRDWQRKLLTASANTD